MSASAKDKLVAALVSAYPRLTRMLADRLGSVDRAEEALNDTYVRLHRESVQFSEVRDPQSYLYRMAMNAAGNQRERDDFYLSAADIEELIELPDEAPDPLRVAEGRSELEAVQRALDALPERRRAVFRRVWIEGASYAVVAAEFGLAERTARYELLQAVRAMHEATKKNSAAALQKRLAELSSK
ncbi:RNA polymerase sigma factor [Sphingomonas sp. H39-1-10]|uniref:RNA polymerase sigma factor n=1 Tax=Sphingomonas pollutisoli TaxID=3030829 RepID=UPI0023B9F135|nr:RNA polymerase sigma factor [Sphingomonas pollutisoli]MDF0490370.1 RNA polymerase sigma factor [Sphingomonas pollutisoli]